MAITSEYFNENGEQIPFEQTGRLNTYCVMLYENNKRLRYEIYVKGIKRHTSYYINSDAVIQKILLAEPTASFIIESKIGNYQSSDSRSYLDGVLTNWRKYVTDTNSNEIICTQIIDPFNGEVIHRRTEKSYFDTDGTEIYLFSYSDDGSCFFIEKVQEYQTDFYAKSIGKDPDLKFTWQGFEYYQYSEPLVPKNDV